MKLKKIMAFLQPGIFIPIILIHCLCSTCSVSESEYRTRSLELVGSFENNSITESSGIIKSSKHEGIFWTHNDSGNSATLYPVTLNGTSASPTQISIGGATNVDWEDIAIDDTGNIIIADIGNNNNLSFDRSDLCLYIFSEPDPIADISATSVTMVPYTYPDYPLPSKYNFDAEAIFWARNTVYLFTKHWLDENTTLYRFDDLSGASTVLSRLDDFNCQGKATAADASPDGNKVVLLVNVFEGITVISSIVWVFEVSGGDDYFNGTRYRLDINAGQCEGICFIDDTTLLITNEKGTLYRLNTSQLVKIN